MRLRIRHGRVESCAAAAPRANRLRTPQDLQGSIESTMDTSRLRELAISDAGFVFDPTTGHTFNVNATALFMLRALKEHAPVDRILNDMAAAFDVEPEHDLARDLDEFISRLREQGLIR
jgi:PqqD family protein of HPr-rel-A system